MMHCGRRRGSVNHDSAMLAIVAVLGGAIVGALVAMLLL
jgi:hypothetical protein